VALDSPRATSFGVAIGVDGHQWKPAAGPACAVFPHAARVSASPRHAVSAIGRNRLITRILGHVPPAAAPRRLPAAATVRSVLVDDPHRLEHPLGDALAVGGEVVEEMRDHTGRCVAAHHPALLVDAGLAVDEDVLELHGVAIAAEHLADADDLARPLARARLLASGPRGEVGAGHEHQRLETADALLGVVGVERGQRTVVTGVHRLEHVERLTTATLSDDNPIGPHAQRVDHQFADRHTAAALDVGRPGLERHHVLLAELELGGVLDGDDALVLGDEAGEDVECGGLSRPGAAADHHVEAAAHAGP